MFLASLRSFLASRIAIKPHNMRRTDRQRYRPRIDCLEQRLAPATLTVDDDLAQRPNADFTSIQAAVDAANPGDTIRVFAGVYNESVEIDKTLKILGVSNTSRASKANFPDPSKEAIVRGDVDDLFGFNLTADRIVLDGFVIEDITNGPGVVTSGSSAGYRITDNVIQDNVFGISLQNDGVFQARVERNIIRDNNLPGVASGNGIYSDGGLTNAVIGRNVFSGHDNLAITLAGGSDGSEFSQTRLSISRNTSTDDRAFIFSFNTTNSRINRNTINDVRQTGIFLAGGNSGLVIDRNTLSGGEFEGIRMRDASTDLGLTDPHPNSSNLVFANTISNFGFGGVSLSTNSIGNEIIANRISDIADISGDFGDGIVLDDNAHDNFIAFNVSVGNGRDGVRLEVDTYNNTIQGNRLRNNDEHDAHDDSVGFRTAGTANIWIDNQGETENVPGLLD